MRYCPGSLRGAGEFMMRSPVTYVLPTGRPSGGGSSTDSPPTQSSNQRRNECRILLVSGKVAERTQWQALLTDKDLRISFADNGRSALRVIETGGIDLAIAAVMMDEMDGIELVRSARAIKDAPPIIVVARGHSKLDQAYLRSAAL